MAEAFHVTGDTTRVVAGTTTTQTVTLITPEKGDSLRFLNAAAAIAYWKTGDASVVATANDTPLAPSSVEVFRKPAGHTHIAVMLAAGTGNVHVTVGAGQ